MRKIEYTPEKCECCGQSMTYILAIDRGTINIIKKIAQFIGKKGINVVHPRKEMEGTWLTSNDVGNLSRARSHGLIARIKGKAGNYCLTRKGATFLRGEEIPRYAIISKIEHCQIGYFEPEKDRVDVNSFRLIDEPYWQGIGYDVDEGRVIKTLS